MRPIITLVSMATTLCAQPQAVGVFGQIGPVPTQVGRAAILPAPGRGPMQPPPPPEHSDCAIDGYVVNSVTGEPIPRAQVSLSGAYGQQATRADNSGRWGFTNVACAPVQVMGSRPGFLTNTGGFVMAAAMRPVTLVSGSPVHDFKVQLIPQSVVTGKVLDDQGDPVMNAQVSALTPRVVEGRRIWQPAHTGITNDIGEFRLAGLASATYVICVQGNSNPMQVNHGDATVMGESCYPGPVEGGAGSGMELPAGRDTRVDFTLHPIPAVHVRGVITDLPKNQHVGISLVRRGAIGGQGNVHPAMVNPEGKFDIAGVPSGAYLLQTDYFEAGKRLTARVPVDVGSADVEGITVHLEPGFTVSGNVRIESASGATAPALQSLGIHLAATEPMIGGGRIEWAKDSPSFTFNDVSPGVFRLEMFGQGKYFIKSAMLGGRDISREAIPITQSAGPIEVVISDDSGTVEAQVSGPDDQPTTSWLLLLRDGRAARTVHVGADGHAKIAGLAPGDYRAYAWNDVQQVEYANPDWMQQNGRAGVPVTIAAGQTAQITLKQQIAPAR